jgi:hypothetical protein
MIREEEARGHRGGRRLGMAASLNRLASVTLVGGILCGAMPDGLAQDGHSQGPSPSNESVEQALRALGRGLTERAKDLEDDDHPAATGSVGPPFPRIWIAPAPLAQTTSVDAPSAVAVRDVQRLFDPRPLGAPQPLHQAEPDAQQQASLPEPQMAPPAPPPPLALPAAPPPPAAISTAPQAAPPREQARLPEPPIVTPPPPRPAPPTTAAIEPPRSPSPTPPPAAARPKDEPEPRQDRVKSSPSKKPVDPTPAVRKSPAPVRSARREEPPIASGPSTTGDEAPARRPVAPKPVVRSRAMPRPQATGSVARAAAPRIGSQEAPSRPALRRMDVARPARSARQQPSDIPIIPLPEALRPTRPSAGSPL